MNEDEFSKAFYLIREFTPTQIAQAKKSLFAILQELENEKRNISNEVRRSVYYFQVSNKVKEKRIKYIDEIIVPGQSAHLESHVNDVFPELRTTSLARLRQFRKERERLMKVTHDHSLRVKLNARILADAYAEVDGIEIQYRQINQAEIVRHFFQSIGVSPQVVIAGELDRYYRMFSGGGGR